MYIPLTKKVWWLCSKCGYEWKTSVYVRNNGAGCPCCSNQVVVKGKNDLESRYPEVAKEWNCDLNDRGPADYVFGSSKKAWWKCNTCNGEWEARIVSRTTQGQGCPYCSGRKVLQGFNDLSTVAPEIAKEWDYQRNGELLPTKVNKGSHKIVYWKCNKGHEYQMRIDTRVNSKSCIVCKKQKL